MDLGNVGFLAIGSALGAFVGKVKSFFIGIKQYAIQTTILVHDHTRKVIVSFFRENFQLLDRFKPKVYYKNTGIGGSLIFSSRYYNYKGFALYKKKYPCWVEVSFEYPYRIRVDYIRGTISEKTLVEDLHNFKVTSSETDRLFTPRRFYVDSIIEETPLAVTGPDKHAESPQGEKSKNSSIVGDFSIYNYKVTYDIYIGDEESLRRSYERYETPTDYLKDRFPFFYWSREFKELLFEGLFWKKLFPLYARGYISKASRGCLLYGPPGSGKTMMVSMVARYLDVPVIVVDLNTISESTFLKDVRRRMTGDLIVLYEDIDAVFDKRKNIHPDNQSRQRTKFNTFLNVLDGVDKDTVAWTIITTNNPDKLDSALVKFENGEPVITRPGRIDKVIGVSLIDQPGKEHILTNMLKKYYSKAEIDKWVAELSKRDMTAAQVCYFCEQKMKEYVLQNIKAEFRE